MAATTGVSASATEPAAGAGTASASATSIAGRFLINVNSSLTDLLTFSEVELSTTFCNISKNGDFSKFAVVKKLLINS